MTYTALRLCGELFLLIGEKKTVDEIAKWAFSKYLDVENCAETIEVFLDDLSIADEPGFEMTIPEIVKRSLGILEAELMRPTHTFSIRNNITLKPDILHICGELFLLIDKKTSVSEIAEWAYSTCKSATDCSERVRKFLGDLSVIEYSEFSISNSEIVKNSINILLIELMNT